MEKSVPGAVAALIPPRFARGHVKPPEIQPEKLREMKAFQNSGISQKRLAEAATWAGRMMLPRLSVTGDPRSRPGFSDRR